MKKVSVIVLIIVAGTAAFLYFSPKGDFFGGDQCFPGEKYDPQEDVCYIECDTEQECAEIEKRIAEIAKDIGDDYFEGEKEYLEPEEPEEKTIAEYSVKGDDLSPKPGDKRHQEIWNYFVKLIPPQYRAEVVGFDIFSDGKEGTYAAVYQDSQDFLKWRLAVDPDDAYDGEKINDKDLTFSLIHEQGHLLTLNAKQVEFNIEIARAETNDQAEQLTKEAEQKCQPRYFVGEGCSKKDSYINIFFQRFWKGIYEQRRDSDPEQFYQQYKDQFVTEYAASDPSEDIAESWTAFVLKDRPADQSVAETKVLIFYNYPELKTLREAIRNRFVNLFFVSP